MASAASSSLANAAVLVPLFSAVGAASAAYAGHALLLRRGDWRAWLAHFLTGPGRTSRVLVVLLLLLNLKSLPFYWTFRVFGAMIRHTLWPRPPSPPQALFRYLVTTSRTSLLETDYNLHKSNSTYFADLDASRSHLVMHLLGPGVKAAGRNQQSKLVLDAETGKPMPGSFGVGLGAVFCSFRKEVAPLQAYELWSRVLAWDRKWLYIVTHFVQKGKVRPGSKGKGKGGATLSPEDLQKYVIATAVSKYVFKLGRFTVHPTYLIDASGLLPERPGEGSWRGGGPDAVGDPAALDEEDDSNAPEADDDDAPWDWKRIERERRRGMIIAEQFGALDGAGALFDGGRNGTLGHFFPG